MLTLRKNLVGIIAILAAIVVFIVPFGFILTTAMKPRVEAALLEFSWPQQFAFFENSPRWWPPATSCC